MTNGYFNHDAPLARHTLARAEELNAKLSAVAAGFGRLPPEAILKQGRATYGAATGAADSYAVTLPYAPASYTEGMRVTFRVPAGAGNSGASAVNINGLGVKPVLRIDGAATIAGDLPAGGVVDLCYDGTAFRLAGAHGGDVLLAQGWAGKADGPMTGGGYSALAWASLTGVAAPPAGSARQWAESTDALIGGAGYSAREHAAGDTVPTGSAKAWAVRTGAPVSGGEYSAKHHAGLGASSATAASWSAANALNSAAIASTRAAEAAASATAAASLVQIKSPADIAGIPPVIDLPLTSPDGVPTGVVLGRNGTRATGADGVLVFVPVGVGVAPIDHHPLTGECLGLLCEEARANVIKHASDFGHSAWSKVRSTITENAAVAPDGTATADKLVESTDTGAHSVFQVVSPALGTVVHTFSVYAKAGERSSFWVLGQDAAVTTNGGRALFTLAGPGIVTSVAVMGSGTGATADIKPWKGGWYRCCLTVTCGSGSELRLKADMLSGSGTDTYTGDGASGLYLWGAQVEAGAFATSPIPTTSAAVTRAADVNTLSLARATGRWNAAEGEGTLLVEASSSATDAAQRRAVSLRDGSAQNAMGISRFGSSAQSRAVVTLADVSQFNSLTAVWPMGSHRKVALAYRANDFAACLGGGAVVTDQSGSIPAVTTLVIGDYVGGAYAWSGHVRRITHFPVRLSDSTLQLLTA